MSKTTDSRPGVRGDPADEDSDQLNAPELPAEQADVDEFSPADEISGSPGKDPDKQGLMHTVLEADKPDIDLGNMVLEAAQNNVSLFTPEILMEKFVKDYRNAEELYGERLVRQLTGHPPEYVERNMRIPEFRRHLEERIKQNFKELQDQGILGRHGEFTSDAWELATIALAVDELDHLSARGLIGKRVHKRRSVDGVREETKPYRGESFRSLSVQQSVKTAVRRGHAKLLSDDLRAFEKEARGAANIVYAVDASGSMKGQKIAHAKRAGVALAYKGIQSGDKVGLLVFGRTVEIAEPPGKDFNALLYHLARLRTGSETDIAAVVRKAAEMFPRKGEKNHLILLTDALPTIGDDPEAEVLAAVAAGAASDLTLSVIGIGLDRKGEALARRMVDLGGGKLSIVQDLGELDALVLAEYDRVRSL